LGCVSRESFEEAGTGSRFGPGQGAKRLGRCGAVVGPGHCAGSALGKRRGAVAECGGPGLMGPRAIRPRCASPWLAVDDDLFLCRGGLPLDQS